MKTIRDGMYKFSKVRWSRLIMLFVAACLLAGMVVTTPNQIVQASDLVVANFDSGDNGFSYEDDVFGTSQPTYASGSRVTGGSCYGGSGGCLNVRLGGVDNNTINNMSGGWRYSFTLASAETGVSLSLRYRLAMPAVYDYDEFSRMQVSLDGVLIGRGSKSYVDHVGGDNTFAHDAGWLQVDLYIGNMAAGSHTLTLGGFSNKKTSSTEITDIYVDTVALTSGNLAPIPSSAQILVDRLDLATFKSDIQSVASFGDRCRMTSTYGTNCVPPYTSYFNAQNWLAEQLAAMGYTVQYNTYTTSLPGTTGSNLYVTKVGSVHPESMYIVSNMFDGRGGGGAADDDASGVALTMEIARVLASPDVQTDYSVRFIFFDEEERGLIGSQAYVSTRQALRGIENPPGSGLYPEPNWLGIIQHDMILYDHGVGTRTTDQSPYADLDVEWTAGATFANQSMALAQTWRFLNGQYASIYPANSADKSQSTDDYSFRNHCPAVSVRENRRSLSGEWINPYYHNSGDVYSNYSEADFLLGYNAMQTTLGVVAELAGARLTTSNQAPVAFDQTVTTNEDNALAVTLTGSDPEGGSLNFTVLTQPGHGELSGNAPALTYTPTGDFFGSDSFTFKVNDGTSDSAPATVSITVNPVNDLPVALPVTVTTDEDMPVSVTLNASDVDGDSLSYFLASSPAHGSLSGSAPNLTYAPSPNFFGSDGFNYYVNDGTANSSEVTVTITVNSVNDLPVAYPQSLETQVNTALPITLTGFDVETSALNFNIVAQPAHGSLSGIPPQVSYTPASGYTGNDSFTFTVSDGTAISNQAAITIVVRELAYQLPFVDDFETEKGWLSNPDGTDTSKSGQWERANPEGTNSQGPKQLDITTSETQNLVTGHFAGSNASKHDVDKLTSIISPAIQLPVGQDILLSFNYYFAHASNATSDDYFKVQVIGDTTLTVLEIRANKTDVDAVWQNAQINLNTFSGQLVMIRFEASDGAKDSLVEAAVDDLSIIASESTAPLLSADFDSDANDFVYQDDAFRGTNQPDYASGMWVTTDCLAEGCLQVNLGGLDTQIITGISGGWGRSFTLTATSDVLISFWYKLSQSPDYDLDEFSQMLVSLNGILYGAGVNDFVVQIDGNGNGGITESTGWQLFSLSIEDLAVGTYQLQIGGFNNQKSYTNESTEVLIDQVLVTKP